jgi:uncharacterized RDD family membrane protein YckC
MAEEPNRAGVSFEVKPHAYDPARNPELFEGVLARRIVAFVIDLIILAVPILFAGMFIFAIGIVTLGLGFALYGLLPALSVVWALVYYGSCFGGPHSATIGMRIMDLEMRTWYGSPSYFVLGAVHAIVYWLTVSASCTTSSSAPWSSTANRGRGCCAKPPGASERRRSLVP